MLTPEHLRQDDCRGKERSVAGQLSAADDRGPSCESSKSDSLSAPPALRPFLLCRTQKNPCTGTDREFRCRAPNLSKGAANWLVKTAHAAPVRFRARSRTNWVAEQARLAAPMTNGVGVSTAYGLSGTQYNADADGIFIVAATRYRRRSVRKRNRQRIAAHARRLRP